MIRGIAAIGPNGALGLNNDLLYRDNLDLARFKKLTMGRDIVMGRKTWESLGSKPLPGRRNWVLSTTMEGPNVIKDPCDLLPIVGEDFDVIGGEAIFNALKWNLTHLELTVFRFWKDGDTYFPMEVLEYFTVFHEEHHHNLSFYALKAT
jgi:dihydrofolate reductase